MEEGNSTEVESKITNTEVLDLLTILPEEISVQILSFCAIIDLGRCCLVSKEWRRLAEDNAVWVILCRDQ